MRGADEVRRVGELPYRGAHDHPEGLCAWPEQGDDALLVIYDAPAPERIVDHENRVLADVIRVPR